LSSLARVGHMIELVESRACEALKARRRRPFLGGRQGALSAGALIHSDKTGYVQNIDPDRLEDAAAELDCQVQILASPGAFVRRGEALARIGLAQCDEKDRAEVRSAFALGDSRSYDQDPRFGLVVLAEIAAKALSPGVNDPGTAVQVIGSGVRLLDIWLEPAAEDEADSSPCNRVLAAPLADADLLNDIFGPIARYGAGDVPVTMRLLKALRSLAATPGPMQGPARGMARELVERSRRALPIPADLARVRSVKV
ncbi:MAG: DUF2254 family protein, partial [Brevundimonas sp.]|nr:DUF2254 family protein [Brevundimonas sp.]